MRRGTGNITKGSLVNRLKDCRLLTGSVKTVTGRPQPRLRCSELRCSTVDVFLRGPMDGAWSVNVQSPKGTGQESRLLNDFVESLESF